MLYSASLRLRPSLREAARTTERHGSTPFGYAQGKPLTSRSVTVVDIANHLHEDSLARTASILAN
ncbi:MAG: hypothetical protein V7K71_00410 [Nostoc sp.]